MEMASRHRRIPFKLLEDGSPKDRKSKVSEKEHHLLVAAIDFGTTYSGYAFAFTSEPKNIRMNKNWALGKFDLYKTPTHILFCPDGRILFGFEAIEKYNEMDDDEKQNYDLFKHFKMMLHDKVITKSMKLSATNGRTRPAVEVFGESLKYLKNHMIQAINKTVVSAVDPNMIRWVITIPAIWRDEAKQFMREAALHAGCITSRNSDQLVLSLEPEAASIFCHDLPVNPKVPISADEGVTFGIGTKYLIVDAGGGTVDITAHQIHEGGYIREILQPTGGPWGGTEVDKAFEELMRSKLPPGVIEGMQTSSNQQWFQLMLNFEHAKKTVKTQNPHSGIKLELNYCFCSTFEAITGIKIQDALPSSKSKSVYFSNGKLVISQEQCLQLFMNPVAQTVGHVRELLQRPQLQDVSFILLVGGFGECEVMQTALKSNMPSGVKLIVPEEAQLAIIKGAVQYGLKHDIVACRFARKTYGIDIEPRFNAKLHSSKNLITKQGVNYCNDVFLKFIDKGTEVNYDDVVSRTLFARTEDQLSMSFDIFCTDEEDLNEVEYVTDQKFIRIGGLTVFMPDTQGGRDRKVEVQFKFGGTEIKVEAKDVTSGKKANTEVDMLLP